MTTPSGLRSKAREALKGKWKFAVGAGLLASLLGGNEENIGTIFMNGTELINQIMANQSYGYYVVDPPMNPSLYPYYVFGIVCTIVMLLIGGMTCIGYSRLNLDFVDGKALSIRQIVSEYPRFLRGLAMTLLTVLYVLLWMLLLIIPGIIASFGYALTPFLMAEYPDMGANEAITLSKKMMQGSKANLFSLYLSFIGWSLLSILTLGIGYIWLIPYIRVTEAAFYREVSQKYWQTNQNPYHPIAQIQDDFGSAMLESKGIDPLFK